MKQIRLILSLGLILVFFLVFDISLDDRAQLRKFVLKEICEEEDICDFGFFERPTLENTSVLRNYVHQRLTADFPEGASLIKLNKNQNDIIELIRGLEDKNGYVYCGGMSLILYRIYEAFGYSAVLSDWMNGPRESYTDSHVISEVFIPEYGKFIIQDATFNMIITYENVPLNVLEMREFIKDKSLIHSMVLKFTQNYGKDAGFFKPISERPYSEYFSYFATLASRSGDYK